MPRKSKSDQEDLSHIIQTCIMEEGYDIDTETEREVARLSKFVIAHASTEDPEDEEEDDDYGDYDEELFDDYGDETEGGEEEPFDEE